MRTPVHTLPARYQSQVAEQLAPFSGAVTPSKPTMPIIRQSNERCANKWELEFADMLFSRPQIIRIKREGLRLRIGNGAYYKPDYVAWNACDRVTEIYEVKGHKREAAIVRLKSAAAQFPEFRFWLCVRIRAGEWSEMVVMP